MTRIFLSSTWNDLAEHRDKVREALDRLRHIGVDAEWIGMEAFPASSRENALAVALRELQECDLYVGVLGPRYGSVSPAHGISFVELEFDEAVRLSKPRLLFLMDEACNEWTALRADDAKEMNDALQRLRHRFESDKHVGYFDSPGDLAMKVTIGLLPDLLAERESAVNTSRGLLMTPLPGAPASIAMTAAPAIVKADGVSSVLVHAKVTDAAGDNVLDGEGLVWSLIGADTRSPMVSQTLGGSAALEVTPPRSDLSGRIIVNCLAVRSGAACAIAVDFEPAG
ncbi:MAG: DUF4062 domain-containing protein [Chloroflexi bacterium]|nr:DUF4062 domain-containing protein [Chloroflexota bacterium]